MSAFNPNDYGEVVAELLLPARLQPLGPGEPDPSLQPKLQRLRAADLFDRQVQAKEMANACLAGLWLYHDFLDESHTISQAISSATGSYWHAIMHRREPDFGNSKYWFRRVGNHPIFDELHKEASLLIEESGVDSLRHLSELGHWDPFEFVDLCEQFIDNADAAELLCRRIQQREWELLFDYSYGQALKR